MRKVYQVKVTPDSGKRYILTVERDDLGATVSEVARRVALGQVVCFTVHTVYEKVGA